MYNTREKRFVKSGNSYALVVDRSLLEQVGLSVEKPVRLRVDGIRLIIEKVEDDFDPDRAAALAWEIRRLAFNKTWQRIGHALSRENLVALGATPGESRRWRFDWDVDRSDTATPELELVMDRLEHVRDLLSDHDLPDAIR
ncbi:MAG: AbrB/MazE/SpoVT family DNA-binding domain-containing protein [Kofleriaceae bacterium]